MPPVTVYYRDFCGYSARAMNLLDAKGVKFEAIDAGSDATLKREMVERSGRSTYPQIFIGDQHIGGCDDLMALDRAGDLDDLLAA